MSDKIILIANYNGFCQAVLFKVNGVSAAVKIGDEILLSDGTKEKVTQLRHIPPTYNVFENQVNGKRYNILGNARRAQDPNIVEIILKVEK